MTFQRPTFRHPELPPNAAGYTRREYEGGLSTLCAGCGHDSICNAIIQACFELALSRTASSSSGIGCSSKTPAYFLNRAHGFNTVHGRMPSIATGANMANRDLIYLGVSGDGDNASIGMGQFVHAVRRNLDMLYIVMNNGCYGLTKGQYSATADKGTRSKKGGVNPLESIDLCELAIQLGAGFVARSFAGDKRQLVPLIKAGSPQGAVVHRRDLALRHLQQQPGIDQELPLGARAQRGHRHGGLRPLPPDHRRRLRRRCRGHRGPARRVGDPPAQAQPGCGRHRPAPGHRQPGGPQGRGC